MFNRPMKVSAEDATVLDESKTSVVIHFIQRWSSGSYGDVGRKSMRVVLPELQIDQEELFESVPEPVPSGRVELSVADANSPDLLLTVLQESDHSRPPLLTFSKDLPKSDGTRTRLGVCSLTDALPVIALFRRAVSLQIQSVPTSTAGACPQPSETSEDDESGAWGWPIVAEARGVGPRLTLMAWPYHGHQLGDFAREYKLLRYIAILRDGKGVLQDVNTESSGSDFATLDSLAIEGTKAIAMESYIDSPCNGSDSHTFDNMERTITFRAVNGELTTQTTDKKFSSDTCSDAEAQLYRDPTGD